MRNHTKFPRHGGYRRAASIAISLAAACTICAILAGCAQSGDSQRSSEDASQTQGSQTSASQLPDAAELVIDVENPITAFSANSSAALLPDPGDGVVGNSCYSPASYYLALAMVAAGSDGEAQQQLLQALGMRDNAELATYCKEQCAAISRTDDDGATKIANSLWSNVGFNFTEDYTSTVNEYFDGGAFDVEFGLADTDQTISAWISKNTDGLIEPQVATDASMVAMLVNTIYFKDTWMQPFTEEASDTGAFHAESGDVDAQFMHATTDFGTYMLGGNFTAAQLPFSGGSTMTFYLPNEGTDVDELISTPGAVLELLRTQPNSTADINWSLPKFTIESRFDNLADVARKIGVSEIFDSDNTAMFRPMIVAATGEDLDFYVSDVLQETKLDLNEFGVEAAAYTSIAMRTTSLGPDEPETVDFVLDRPFVYALTAQDGTPLFIGVVRNPEA